MPGGGDPFVGFDLDEAHPSWPAASALLRKWQASDVPRTEFTTKEVDSAHWSEITAWNHGYPQPDEGNFGYRLATYDLEEWCDTCGIGAKQKAPFQMKGEPRWGRRGAMQLTWIEGELFVTPEVWTRVFEPAGVRCMPVRNTKGAELTSVVQLVVDNSMTIVSDGLPAERCTSCGRTKYLPVARGPFPPLRDTPTDSMVRTAQYFGSGALAFQPLLVNREIARALSAASVRGPDLRPVAERTNPLVS